MTAQQLRIKFIDEFGIKTWPATYEVDAETYGYVCQDIIDNKIKEAMQYFDILPDGLLDIHIGENGGIMFKGVELILLRK